MKSTNKRRATFSRWWSIGLVLVFLGVSLAFTPSSSLEKAALLEETSTSTLIPTSTPVPGALLSLDQASTVIMTDLNDNDFVDPGDTVQYTITFYNTGGQGLNGLNLVAAFDNLSIEVFKDISHNGISNDQNTINWDFDTLDPGEGRTITFLAQIKNAFIPDGPVVLETTVTISNDDISQVKKTQIIIRVPKLEMNKIKELIIDENNDGVPDPGDTLAYTITINNTSDVEATNINIIDYYQEDYLNTPANITKNGIYDNNNINWQLETIAAEEIVKLEYEAKLLTVPEQPEIGTRTIENEVILTGDGIEELSDNVSFDFLVPTPTPTPTPEPKPEPTPVSVGPLSGVSEQIVLGGDYIYLVWGLIGLFAIGLIILAVLSLKNSAVSHHFRDIFVLVITMSTIIILGTGGVIEHSAVAGLIGTIAGYLLRGARSSTPAPDSEK